VTTDRVDALRAMLAENPEDSFARYALALELRSRGRTAAALDLLEMLALDEPDNHAAWFQLGDLRAELGAMADARDAFEQAVAAAEAQGDLKAAAESRAALDAL
jgi:predicted Zn-dependent protease